ncbi:potassium channel family protein [Embleya sp. NBC_00888]|uniref:potassium channel family protein n=1 Tax=Embleya sp. NBC_00888 TaxID=2975960 RepID=UPI00386B1401|nr:potassium channel family protein [Embleya sp. NBC_00888]
MKTVRFPDDRPADRRGPRGALARPLPALKKQADGPAGLAGQAGATVHIPKDRPGPLVQVLRRFGMALLVLAVTILVVYLDRDGYRDTVDEHVSLLDAVYYATVTLSTTGYGDITPASDGARLVNVVVITPLRVVFLIILVGTTLEVLTERTREQLRLNRWRSTLRDHTILVGYGTTGYSAVHTLMAQGISRENIVVVDSDPEAATEASDDDKLVVVSGDATRAEVLRRAEVERARNIIVSVNRDDTAALVTLTARQLNRRAWIVVAVREDENAPLIRQSGADSVVTTASAAGRLLGLSMLSPNVGEVMEDLMHYGEGMDLIERPIDKREAGKSPGECGDLVVAVVRGHRTLRHDDPEAAVLGAGDRLVVIKTHKPQPKTGDS